ncbi:dopamine receptor 2 isoform X2 [Planococcus citri]|uniref:dopamine receptor 2 isoform X2 n=1 Tax=Planococcus citri TaxID=170843 RepID=UPI0031F8728E
MRTQAANMNVEAILDHYVYNVSSIVNATSAGDGIAGVDDDDDVYSVTIRKISNLSRNRIALGVLLLLFSVVTVLGNLLVIVAVIRERYLHSSTNYFVMSLASADGLVGLVVMPLSTLYEITDHHWIFGINWCDAWRSLDVLFSTASILNLCVISLDRYWAITDPFTYPTKMSRRKAYVLICVVWVCSSVISFPAIIWWRAVRDDVPNYQCPFTDNLGYLIFSSFISFYLPLFVMVFTYFRIYRAAVFQTRSLKSGSKQVSSTGETGLTLRIHRGGTERQAACTSTLQLNNSFTSVNGGLSRQPSATSTNRIMQSKSLHKNFSLSRKLSKFAKEKKAAKTLGIVMGVFIICWLPFFVLNLASGFCDKKCIWNEDLTTSIATWLGWMNSGMNPFIYACWSKDFRRSQLCHTCIQVNRWKTGSSRIVNSRIWRIIFSRHLV